MEIVESFRKNNYYKNKYYTFFADLDRIQLWVKFMCTHFESI